MFCAGEKPFQVPENKSVILAPTIPFPHIKPCWEFLLEHYQIQTLNMLNLCVHGHFNNSQYMCGRR